MFLGKPWVMEYCVHFGPITYCHAGNKTKDGFNWASSGQAHDVCNIRKSWFQTDSNQKRARFSSKRLRIAHVSLNLLLFVIFCRSLRSSPFSLLILEILVNYYFFSVHVLLYSIHAILIITSKSGTIIDYDW